MMGKERHSPSLLRRFQNCWIGMQLRIEDAKYEGADAYALSDSEIEGDMFYLLAIEVLGSALERGIMFDVRNTPV